MNQFNQKDNNHKEKLKVLLEGHLDMSYFLVSKGDLEYLKSLYAPQIDGVLTLLISVFITLASILITFNCGQILQAILSALAGGTLVAAVARHLVVSKRKHAFLAKIEEISERTATPSSSASED